MIPKSSPLQGGSSNSKAFSPQSSKRDAFSPLSSNKTSRAKFELIPDIKLKYLHVIDPKDDETKINFGTAYFSST